MQVFRGREQIEFYFSPKFNYTYDYLYSLYHSFMIAYKISTKHSPLYIYTCNCFPLIERWNHSPNPRLALVKGIVASITKAGSWDSIAHQGLSGNRTCCHHTHKPGLPSWRMRGSLERHPDPQPPEPNPS